MKTLKLVTLQQLLFIESHHFLLSETEIVTVIFLRKLMLSEIPDASLLRTKD